MKEENDVQQSNAEQNNAEKKPIQFAVKRIYVKDLSFEAPAVADMTRWQPKVSQDLNTELSKVDDTHYEVVLKLTVTVKQEEKTAFLIEVHQAGLFLVDNVEGQQLQHMLSSACPQILFPYVREAVDSLAIRGGFPPLNLPPINFDALFARALSEAQAQESNANGS